MRVSRLPVLCAATIALGACDTFRSLDSVARPDGADLGIVDMAMADAGPSDVRIVEDTATIDLGYPDLARDLGMGDVAPDVGMDVGMDMGVPIGCPASAASPPGWVAALSDVPEHAEYALVAADALPNVSLAASSNRRGEPGAFVAGLRVSNGGTASAQLVLINGTFPFQSVDISDATADPPLDIAVAATPDPAEFAYFAIGENPTCSVSGTLGYSGVASVVGTQFLADVRGHIDAECGAFRPRAAITGPYGAMPNLRVTGTATGILESLAYPFAQTTPWVGPGGTTNTDHVSASSKDVVVVSSDVLDRWWVWRPASGDQPDAVDLNGAGDLEIAWLHDDCYAAVTSYNLSFNLAPIDCPGPCVTGPMTTKSDTAAISRADIARMPGGGFVVVAAVGFSDEGLRAHFFDDAFQPVGSPVDVMPAPGGLIEDFAVATTWDGDDVLIGTVSHVEDSMLNTSVVRADVVRLPVVP